MADPNGNCHNCGKPGHHWIPYYEGVPGYYVCRPKGK